MGKKSVVVICSQLTKNHPSQDGLIDFLVEVKQVKSITIN